MSSRCESCIVLLYLEKRIDEPRERYFAEVGCKFRLGPTGCLVRIAQEDRCSGFVGAEHVAGDVGSRGSGEWRGTLEAVTML